MSNAPVPGQELPNEPIGPPCSGLYLDRPSHTIDPKGLDACNNVRIELGRVRSDFMGWASFLGSALNGAIDLIYTFQMTSGVERLIFGTPTDLYHYNGGTPKFITPAYVTGTISVNNASPNVTGASTFWNTPIGGNSAATATVDALADTFAVTVSSVPAGLTVGTLVADASNPAAIQVGTLVAAITGDTILLSKSIAFDVLAGDTIRFGGQLANFRKNVRSGDQIAFTSNAENDPGATWYTVQSVTDNTHLVLSSNYSGANLAAHTYTVRQCSPAWASASSPFGSFTNHWEVETFPQAGAPWNKDIVIFVNGVDPTIVWDGIATFAQFATTVPFIATTLRRVKNLMVYGGLIGSNGQLLPTSMANSDNGLPTTMAGGVAFQGVVSDGPYIINHIGVLGNVLMLYMGGALGGTVTSASFVGLPNIWAFAEVIRGRGPIAGRLVAEFPDRHQFMAQDGQYRYNGVFIQVMNDHIWRPVLKNFDPSRADRAFNFISQTYGDVQWAVPLLTDGGQPLTTAYTEAYMEQANSFLFKPYTQRDFPFSAGGIWPNINGWTWNQFTGAFSSEGIPIFDNVTIPAATPIHLVGDTSGNLFVLYSGNTKNGSTLTSYAQYPKRLVENAARGRGLWKRVYPFLEVGSTTLSVILTLYDSVSGPSTITDTQSFNTAYPASSDGTVFRYTKHFRRGRVGQVKIQATGPWVLDGYDIDWIPGGLR